MGLHLRLADVRPCGDAGAGVQDAAQRGSNPGAGHLLGIGRPEVLRRTVTGFLDG